MRFLPLLLTLLLPCVALGQAPVPADITTRSGHTYKAAKVMRVEPDGITYMYAGGMSKIPFEDLPDAIRKQYGYDPQKAAAFSKADEQAQAQAMQQADLAAGNVQLAQHVLDIKTATDLQKRDAELRNQEHIAGVAQGIAKRGFVVRARIQQALDEGALVSYKIRQGLYNWPEDEEDSWIYVASIQKGRVDGDVWEGTVFPFGTFQYNNTSGAQRTVKGYATSASAAAALSERK